MNRQWTWHTLDTCEHHAFLTVGEHHYKVMFVPDQLMCSNRFIPGWEVIFRCIDTPGCPIATIRGLIDIVKEFIMMYNPQRIVVSMKGRWKERFYVFVIDKIFDEQWQTTVTNDTMVIRRNEATRSKNDTKQGLHTRSRS